MDISPVLKHLNLNDGFEKKLFVQGKDYTLAHSNSAGDCATYQCSKHKKNKSRPTSCTAHLKVFKDGGL